jgi:tetraacyldisaccharide 4'-kinase
MPLNWIYAEITDLRNWLYDQHWLEAVDLRARTISVGNLTVGGTGKTPLVAYLAGLLLKRGEKVCILTRGYKREDPKKRVLVADGEQIIANAGTAGDEPFELAQKLSGRAVMIADADRAAAGEWAKRKFGITAFLLDDGFQHRKVKRDIDIVCIDATDPWGGGQTLPSGRLRESANGLDRADIVVITRADIADQTEFLELEVSLLNSNKPVFTSVNRVVRIVPLKDPEMGPPGSRTKVLAFCAIGNPQSFFKQLRMEGFDLSATKAYRDHHSYTQRDIGQLEQKADDAGAEILLTTAKDAVKLSDLNFRVPRFVVEIEMVINDAAAFEALI